MVVFVGVMGMAVAVVMVRVAFSTMSLAMLSEIVNGPPETAAAEEVTA